MTIPCDPYDKYDIIVYEHKNSDSGSVIGSDVGKLLCMYVRREIRSLSKGDLSSAMTAMYEVAHHSLTRL